MHPTASPTRLAIRAALAAAVLLLVAVLASASARTSCDSGEFCVYSDENLTGGLYQFTGSDSDADVRKDVFESEDTTEGTGLLAQSAQNKGVGDPSLRNDVLVFTEPGFDGNRACIRRGASGNLVRGFAFDISSYKWVTRAVCERFGSALEPSRQAG
jgi:Peptidase inhibitor family I36